MTQPESEADARIEIDELLRQAGWDPADKSMVGTEIHSASGDGSHSRADYVLYDQRGRPLAVIEAKKNAIDPNVAKRQALPYAQSLIGLTATPASYIERNTYDFYPAILGERQVAVSRAV